MAQRNSGYKRVDHNFYPTPRWVTNALVSHVLGQDSYEDLVIWEPAAGDGAMLNVFKEWGFKAYGTDLRKGLRGVGHRDFLNDDDSLVRPTINAIITNPPYGRAEGVKNLSEAFILKALEMMEPVEGLVAMLLRVDFDSAVTRTPIFADHPAWGTKLVLTRRIKWFEDGNPNGPSENHAWYVWDWSRNEKRQEIIYGQ